MLAISKLGSSISIDISKLKSTPVTQSAYFEGKIECVHDYFVVRAYFKH